MPYGWEAMTEPIYPTLGKESFSCPHCGAIAHQTWFYCYGAGYSENKRPFIPLGIQSDADQELVNWVRNVWSKKVFFYTYDEPAVLRDRLENLYISLCYSCHGLAVWIADRLIFPASKTAGGTAPGPFVTCLLDNRSAP